MKKIPIIAGILILAGAYLLMNATKEMTSYATFADAVESGEKVKIAGVLSRDKEMVYDPEVDSNYFSFFITDADNVERKVILLSERPQDFEQSEQIVVTGVMKDEGFVATDILLKCPSKYKDEEIYIRSETEEG